MSDIFSQQAYQGTFVTGTVEQQKVHKLRAGASLSASNMLEFTFWIERNGERVDSGLGNADYRIRDKSGNLVSGLSQTGMTPDLNGYYRNTPVSGALIYDLTHFIVELEIPIDDIEYAASFPLGIGE